MCIFIQSVKVGLALEQVVLYVKFRVSQLEREKSTKLIVPVIIGSFQRRCHEIGLLGTLNTISKSLHMLTQHSDNYI